MLLFSRGKQTFNFVMFCQFELARLQLHVGMCVQEIPRILGRKRSLELFVC